MSKKLMFILLSCMFILCSLTGCNESTPTDELVQGVETPDVGTPGIGTSGVDAAGMPDGQAHKVQENHDIPAGSSYVENEKREEKSRTFPTLSELHNLVKEGMGDNYWPEIPLSEDELAARTGITKDMYIEFLAEVQIMETNIDTMMIIRAKEDYVGAIEQAFEEYRNRTIEDNEQYPQNLCKAKASRMETVENYICFVQLGADTSIVADKGEKEMIAYCQEENERVIDILEKAILQ